MDASSGDYWLGRGPHATPDEGRCAMEWVSYLAGEPHSDRPACVSPALRSFCVALNDGLGNREPSAYAPIPDADDRHRRGRARHGTRLDGAGLAGADLPSRLARPGRRGSRIDGAGADQWRWRSGGGSARAGCGRARSPRRVCRSASHLTAGQRPLTTHRAIRPQGRSRLRPTGGLGRGENRPRCRSGPICLDTTRAAAADAAAAAARRGTIEATAHGLHESSFALLDRLLPTQPWSRIKMHGTPHVGSWPAFLAS